MKRVKEAFAAVCSLVLCIGFTACSSDGGRPPSQVEAAFDTFERFQAGPARDLTTIAAAVQVGDRYRALFAPYQRRAVIGKLGDANVRFLFRAADAAFSYTVSTRPLEDMQLDWAELRRRGIARQDDDQKVYAALVQMRAFGRAHALANATSPALARSIPDLVDNAGASERTTLLVQNGGKRLVRRAVDLQRRSIVIVASPRCHFCQRAIRSIEADPLLRGVFRDHALWLVPPDGSTSFRTVATWNRLHSSEPMEVAYKRGEWPMIEQWETPVFYCFRGGRVVGKVVGWPVTGRKTELRRCLGRAGLVSSAKLSQAANRLSPGERSRRLSERLTTASGLV